MRKVAIPDPPKAPDSPSSDKLTWKIYTITPMVGGGARSRQADPVSVIRPQSVRGHLRFWWRATVGNLSISELRKAETAIFGNATTPSKLGVRVVVNPVKMPLRISVPPYAAFPFRPININQPDPHLERNEVKFDLTLDVRRLESTQIKQLETAVKCWVNFGGVGARTRRGFGALACDELMFPGINKAIAFLRTFVPAPVQESMAKYPKLLTNFKKIKSTRSQSWSNGIQKLMEFRQGADIGRNGERGRSLWPEAESIRNLVTDSPKDRLTPDFNGHDTSFVLGEDVKGLFPRAEFGAPIIFHIKGEQLARNIDIAPQLVPDGCDRFASPLIIRPLKTQEGYYAIFLQLHAPSPKQWVLKPGECDLNETKSISGNQIRNEVLINNSAYPRSPLLRQDNTARSKKASALQAFMAFVGEKQTT
ncbi:type III-B CRISPR module RAMP protein Cmr1 [bacterium]|nr:type III-B CRISPR module RAMP protein Cmr1 [bacterium]